VFTGSMPTTERCRTLSAQAFGVRPLDVYAITEAGPVAFECPESPEDYHLNDDVQIVEIVDSAGRPVPDGETGEVVITPLTLLSEPLLRYRVGDLAARRPYRCRCGRGLALLGPIEGRARQIIRTPDGRTLNQAGIGPSFRKEHGVKRWQVRHTAPDALQVLVVTESPWSAGGREQTVNLLGSRVGSAMRIEVVEVEDIPVTSAGKFQAIIPLPEDVTPRQKKHGPTGSALALCPVAAHPARYGSKLHLALARGSRPGALMPALVGQRARAHARADASARGRRHAGGAAAGEGDRDDGGGQVPDGGATPARGGRALG
jgi:hypothetical protein